MLTCCKNYVLVLLFDCECASVCVCFVLSALTGMFHACLRAVLRSGLLSSVESEWTQFDLEAGQRRLGLLVRQCSPLA